MITLKNLVLVTIISTAVANEEGVSAVSTIQANGKFAQHMYKEVSQKHGNVLISPAATHASLSMLYQGASGTMKKDFETVLGVASTSAAEGYETILQDLNNAESAVVTIDNKIYVANNVDLKQSFTDIVKSKFSSDVESIDFEDPAAAAIVVNNWVAKTTRNHIKVLDDDDLEGGKVTLIDTINFKDAWKYQFDANYTDELPFYLKDGRYKNVTTMHSAEYLPYKLDHTLDAEIVVFPYKDPDYSMVIVFPNTMEGITELERKLQDVDLTQITKGTEGSWLIISLPKFKFSANTDLEDTLNNMGLDRLFQPTQELDGVGEGPLQISNVVQNVVIQVDENGSEAEVGPEAESVITTPQVPKVFTVDHSFMFMLIHKLDSAANNNNVLFFGKVEEPVFEEETTEDDE